MRTVYNIDFEIAGVAFLIIVAIFVRLGYFTNHKNSVIFRRFLGLLVTAETLDVVTAVMITHADVIHPTINMIANTLYMCAAALTESTLVRYVCAFSKDEEALRVHKNIVKCVTGIYLTMMLVNLFTNVVFGFIDGVYVHGPLYTVTFLIPLFFIVEATYLITVRKDLFGRKLIISAIMFNVLTLIGILTQLLLLPTTLTTYFGASLSVLIMVFTLETPDYQRLQVTMSKLRESNTELEHLRNNLQEEVNHRTEELIDRQNRLENMTFETVHSLASTIDAKDEYTNGHSNRVARYSVMLAEALGWDKESIHNLEMAAVLHDIGKIGIPDRILNKPGKLTEIEYELVQSHTRTGYSILENLPGITGAREVARSHHERYDGKGYPDGLKGEEIPAAARLVGIADAYDAMSSKRVYRSELEQEAIRNELVKNRGTQFDPKMAEVFIRLLDEGKLLSDEKSEEGKTFVAQPITDLSSGEIDLLTGLANRECAENAIREAMRKEDGCLAIIDVDRLRTVNNQFGHRSGDVLLTELAKILKDYLSGAISCRIGGGEFLFFFKAKSEKDVNDTLDGLLERFYALKGDHYHMQGTALSIGAALCHPGDQYEEIFDQADKALYHQKQSGRPGCFIHHSKTFEKQHNITGELETLVQGLEKNGSYDGVLQVDYSEFVRVYELISNITERYHGNYELVMITLDSTEGGNPYVENMDKAMDCMQKSIMQVIRCVDVCTRYSTVQFLVMLMRVSHDDAQRVVDRIFRGFYRIYGSDSIQPDYAIATVKAKKRELNDSKIKERKE